jgi:hypothetical protein
VTNACFPFTQQARPTARIKHKKFVQTCDHNFFGVSYNMSFSYSRLTIATALSVSSVVCIVYGRMGLTMHGAALMRINPLTTRIRSGLRYSNDDFLVERQTVPRAYAALLLRFGLNRTISDRWVSKVRREDKVPRPEPIHRTIT